MRFLRRYFTPDVPPATTAKVAALKVLLADAVPPQRIEGMEWPERDEMKKACVHCYSDNDILALELQREAERKTQPRNVVAMKTRGSVR